MTSTVGVRAPGRLVRGRGAAPAHARRHPAPAPSSSRSPGWPGPRSAPGSTRSSPQACSPPAVRPLAPAAGPPARLAFNPDAGVVLGADLGATHALVALTDLRGRVVAENALRSTSRPRSRCSTGSLAGRRLLSRQAAGPGPHRHRHRRCPGPVEHSTGRPVLPPIMPGWDDYDVPGHVRAAWAARSSSTTTSTSWPSASTPRLPRRRAPDLRQGRDRHRRRHHQRRPAPPRRPGRGGRPRPRRGPARRRHPVHLRQRRLPRGGRERPGGRAGPARAGRRRR